MNIYESSQDYLESILMLQAQKGYARSVDIAMHLGVTKPSVSIAMKRLRENGYIEMGDDNLITLTEKGAQIANKVYERHRVLASFLQKIGVDEAQALEDACKIEHDISATTFDAIKAHLDKLMN